MKSAVVKRSIVIAGHKTSVSLEDAFWEGLKDIASRRIRDYQEFCARGGFCHWQTNLSPKTTANWVLASHHSRGGRFHS